MSALTSPSHQALRAWAQQAQSAVRLDLLDAFLADLAPLVSDERRIQAQATEQLRGGAQAYPDYRNARTARAVAQQRLQILVPAYRQARVLALQLRKGMPLVQPVALAQFLACRALRKPIRAFSAPLTRDEEWKTRSFCQAITMEQASLSRQLLLRHAQLFASSALFSVKYVPSQADLFAEKNRATQAQRLIRRDRLIAQIESAGVLRAEDLRFLRTLS